MKLLGQIFHRRLRGFRIVELAGFMLLLAIVFGLYVFKTGAGAEGAKIADTTRQIGEEQTRVRLLKAKLAELESPERLERLATAYLDMGPVDPKHEAPPGQLAADLRPAPTVHP